MLCQATNDASRKQPGYSQLHPISSTLVPEFAWSLDFLTLPETVEGYNTCFVATDQISQALVLAAMQMDPTHPLDWIATVQVIFEKIYLFFGIPHELTSNRGPQFISQVWRDLWRLMHVQVNLTTAYTPHSSGVVEVQNSIIIKIACKTLKGTGNMWNRILPFIQFYMNNSTVSLIGMMPLQVLLGFNPITPVSMPQNLDCQHPTAVKFITLHNTYHQHTCYAL